MSQLNVKQKTWITSDQKLRDLPDLFNRENSNISKLEIIEFEIKDLTDLLNKAANWRSIDEARGKGLDELAMLDKRGKRLMKYRVLIQRARNTSDGSIDKMHTATSLNCHPSDIHIISANETVDEKNLLCNHKKLLLTT